jgi:hypothetical protein
MLLEDDKTLIVALGTVTQATGNYDEISLKIHCEQRVMIWHDHWCMSMKITTKLWTSFSLSLISKWLTVTLRLPSHLPSLSLLKFKYWMLMLSTAQSTTLFRTNSVVTKMFKFYSRTIGIEYLFNTLGK